MSLCLLSLIIFKFSLLDSSTKLMHLGRINHRATLTTFIISTQNKMFSPCWGNISFCLKCKQNPKILTYFLNKNSTKFQSWNLQYLISKMDNILNFLLHIWFWIEYFCFEQHSFLTVKRSLLILIYKRQGLKLEVLLHLSRLNKYYTSKWWSLATYF